jgi:deoxyadenosine kinase
MAASSSPPPTPPPKVNGFDIHSAAMENVFIGISGLIGAGKSTLATALGKRLNLPVYYEPVQDNEYLEDFYKDIKTHAFAMQVYLLNKRFSQQQVIIWQGKGGVQDRTIYEDSIFAKMLRDSGLMQDRDYKTYISLFQHMSNFMKKPNVIVHLDVSPEESMRRISMRNRGCESGITLEYLQNLKKAYDVFIFEISRLIPVIKVNYERFRTADEMAAAIADKYMSLGRIQHIFYDEIRERENVSSTATNLLLDLCQDKPVKRKPDAKSASSSSKSGTSAPVELAEKEGAKKSRRGRRKKVSSSSA